MKSDFQKAQKLRNNGEIDAAVSLYLKVRNEVLKFDLQLAAECLHMVGVAYYQVEKFKKANGYLEQSLKEFERQNDVEFVGVVLRDLGMVARGQKQHKKSVDYLKESISKLKAVGNKVHEGMSRVKLGRVYADSQKFEKAYKEIDLGIGLLEQSSEKFFLSSAYLDRAKVDVQKSLAILNSFAAKDEFKERRKCIQDFL